MELAAKHCEQHCLEMLISAWIIDPILCPPCAEDCTGVAGYNDSALMVRMAAEAEAQIEQFSQQNLANLAWAYGKLLHYEASLMDSLAAQATLKIKVVQLFQCFCIER